MRVESLILIGVITIIFLFINYNLINDRLKKNKIQEGIFFKYTIEKHKESRDKLLKIEYPEYEISGKDVLDEIDKLINPEVTQEDEKLDEDEIKDEEKSKSCVIQRDVIGNCPGNTFFDNATGCCALKDPEKPGKFETATNIIQDVLVSYVLSEIATRILLRVAAEVIERIGRFATGRVMARGIARGGKILSRQGITRSARIASTRAASRTASLATRKLISGPLTWGTTFIELAGAVFDLADASGYLAAKQTYNDQIQKMRDVIDYQMQLKVLQPDDGSEPSMWPVLMPLGKLYEKEMDEVISEVIGEYFTAAIMHVTTTPTPEDVPQDLGDKILTETLIFALTNTNELSDTQFEMEDEDIEKLSDIAMKLMNGDESLSDEVNRVRRSTRDLTIYKKLEAKSTVDISDIALYPQFSTKSQFGISFSKKAVDDWNQRNYDNYLKQGGIIRGTQTMGEVIACYHGKEYRSINANNPGDNKNPNMVIKYLNEPAPLCGPYGLLVHMCAGAKASAGLFNITGGEPSLNPSAYNVKFNFETMRCEHTGEYCERLAMNYNSNSKQCENKPGQAGAQFLFGETIVNGPIRAWTGATDFIGNLTGSGGAHNEILVSTLIIGSVLFLGPMYTLGYLMLGPTIKDLVASISNKFNDKPIPEQIENDVIVQRAGKNEEVKEEWSFLYDIDKNKFLISGPINFGV